MFVFLSKLLAPLVYPLGMASLLWLAAALLHWRRREQMARRCCAAGIAIVLLFSNPQIGEALLGSLENDYAPTPVADYPVVDAIVVLGGTTAPPQPPRLEVEVGDAFDRLLHGMRLLRAGRAPVLLLSGGVISYLTGSDMSEADRLATLAEEYGVAPAQLLLEPRSRNTYENGLYSAQLLQAHGLRRILLVTSASHMPRSMRVFARHDLEVIAAPTDFGVVDTPLSPMRLMPDVEALRASGRAIKEYVGLLAYWMRGYI